MHIQKHEIANDPGDGDFQIHVGQAVFRRFPGRGMLQSFQLTARAGGQIAGLLLGDAPGRLDHGPFLNGLTSLHQITEKPQIFAMVVGVLVIDGG